MTTPYYKSARRNPEVISILQCLIREDNFDRLPLDFQMKALALKENVYFCCMELLNDLRYSLEQRANYLNELVNNTAGALSQFFHQPRNTLGNIFSTMVDILLGDDINTVGETTSVKRMREILVVLEVQIEDKRSNPHSLINQFYAVSVIKEQPNNYIIKELRFRLGISENSDTMNPPALLTYQSNVREANPFMKKTTERCDDSDEFPHIELTLLKSDSSSSPS